ncbi:MAG: hypothetical protein Q8S29_07190 [Phreatobacter sp.]|nr:hypothetical protein [Phreatobacter sp.]
MTIDGGTSAEFGGNVNIGVAPALLFDTLLPEARPSLKAQVPFASRVGEPGEYAMMIESRVASRPLDGAVLRRDGAACTGAAMTA